MTRLTPAARLSIGLVILTLSILILAQTLGLTSNVGQNQLSTRQEITENLALQSMQAISRNDERLLQAALDNAVERHQDITSAAVRQTQGRIIASAGDHVQHWGERTGEASTPTHIRVPLTSNGAERGALEVAFVPLRAGDSRFLGLPQFVALIIFVGISAFIGFWLFIKRALHHLDPNAVVPARVRNALNILAEGVLILDRREQIMLANSSFIDRLGSSERALIGRKASSLGWHSDSQAPQTLPWLIALESGSKQERVRLQFRSSDATVRTFQVNAVPIFDQKEQCQGAIASFYDISEIENKNNQLEQMVAALASAKESIESKNRELQYLASRDPLTDCFNRRSLREMLNQEFEQADQNGGQLVFMMTDIDHFKKVNDTYGHGLGDDIIKAVAATIKAEVREKDLVFRFGGEEFCILLSDSSIEQAQEIAERCRQRVSEISCDGVKVTSSFGIAALGADSTTPHELMQHADEALYHAKENGRNQVSIWRSSMANKDTEALYSQDQ